MLNYDRDPIKNPIVYDNKLGIKNLDELLLYESKFEASRHYELLLNPNLVKGDFDKKHYLNIHKYLFQDIYPWAGEMRDVDMSKGNTLFCLTQHMDSEFEAFQKKVKAFDVANSSKEDVAKHIAHVSDDLNAIHPCREGNGRTKRAFTELYALHLGYELDYSKFDKDVIKDAEISAFRTGDITNLAKIINGALTSKNELKEKATTNSIKASEVVMAKIKSEDTKKRFDELLKGENLLGDKMQNQYQLLMIAGLYSNYDKKTMTEVFCESKLSAEVPPVNIQQKVNYITQQLAKNNNKTTQGQNKNIQKKNCEQNEHTR
ncbi:MAG: Fic family protein [Clostridia bacterium]